MDYNRVMVNDEYISKVGAQLSQRGSSRELEMKDALRKAEFLKHAGPRFWREVVASLHNAVERIRQTSPTLKLHETGACELTLALAVGSNLHFRDLGVSFDSSNCQINFFITGQTGTFLPEVIGEEVRYKDITIDWDKAFVNRDVRLPMAVDDVVKRLINIVCET